MAEVVLGVVGLVPVLIKAISGLNDFCSYLRTAKKCVKYLNELMLDLETQQVRFTNECTLLLLQVGEDQQKIRSMLSNPSAQTFTNPTSLDQHFRNAFGVSHSLLVRIMGKICEISQSAADDLQAFEAVRAQRKEGESWKVAFKRVYQPVKFGVSKEKLALQISQLRIRITDFEGLRSQALKLQCENVDEAQCFTTKPVPKHFRKVQEISSEIHSAFTTSFHCRDHSHEEHTASLSLDFKLITDASLNMALSCSRRCGSPEPPVLFLLQSKEIDIDALKSSIDLSDNDKRICLGQKTNSTVKISSPCALLQNSAKASGNHCDRVKKRRVTFSEPMKPTRDQKSLKSFESETPSVELSTRPALDLCALSNPCEYLIKICREGTKQEESSKCFAFVRKSQLSRYVFYISRSHFLQPAVQTINVPDQAIFLSDYLRSELKDEVTIDHQIKVARKLCLAVLQFNSTPWLTDEWTISQLQIIPSVMTGSDDLPLYLSSRLVRDGSMTTKASDLQTVSEKDLELSPAERLGIYNNTLFSLGKALLEIGYWKTISEMQDDELDENTVDTVRRLAKRTLYLDPHMKYDEVIRKCIRCDFAFGTDLNRVELQKAFYNEVVCPLEEIISKLEELSLWSGTKSKQLGRDAAGVI